MNFRPPLPRPLRGASLLLAGLALASLLTACRVLDFRQVQRDFQAAVLADNQQNALAVGHDLVVASLPAERIAGLNPKLQPNAWMIRAVSSWRTGDYTNATASADRGLESIKALKKDPNYRAGSRDELVLLMIPALVIDSVNSLPANTREPQLSDTQYRKVGEQYLTALQHLDKAGLSVNANTSEDAIAYLYFHRWRVLQNWRNVINQHTTNFLAHDDAARRDLGKSLGDATKEAKAKIPSGHPLLKVLEALSAPAAGTP